MSGLISRKQTIDALRTCYDTERIDYDNGKEYIDYEQALDLIKELPSADPEFIRCENCKYCEYEFHPAVFGMPVPGDFICRAWGGGCITKPDGFCFLAERRTDDQRRSNTENQG